MTEARDFKIKIIILGEPGVGKTSLVKRFISNHFSNDYRTSIGTNVYLKDTKFNYDDKIIKISTQLWDIAGQERWTSMRHVYYKGAQGAIIVIDLTRKNTLEQIEKFWYQDLKKHCNFIPIILVANKSDLKREIIEDDIYSLGKKINTKSILKTSAKTGENVEHAFRLIFKQTIKDIR
ncbi:MAG: Rab family GTPase [Promethearchaeota archaeon]